MDTLIIDCCRIKTNITALLSTPAPTRLRLRIVWRDMLRYKVLNFCFSECVRIAAESLNIQNTVSIYLIRCVCYTVLFDRNRHNLNTRVVCIYDYSSCDFKPMIANLLISGIVSLDCSDGCVCPDGIIFFIEINTGNDTSACVL